MTEPESDKASPNISTDIPQRPSVPAQLAVRMTCVDPASSSDEDRWFAVWSIALGSFALVFGGDPRWDLAPGQPGLWSLGRNGGSHGGRAGRYGRGSRSAADARLLCPAFESATRETMNGGRASCR
jgi:hypothetical protein